MTTGKSWTTVQIEKLTRDMLRKIAQVNERSMTAQIRVMVRAEYSRLAAENHSHQRPENSSNKQLIHEEEAMNS